MEVILKISLWLRLLLVRFERQRKWNSFWKERRKARWELHSVSRYIQESFSLGLLRPGMSVIDVGCGLGYNASWLSQQGLRVRAIDVSAVAVQQASSRFHGQYGLTFSQVDFTREVRKFSQVDAIIDRGCLHGLPKETWSMYFQNIIRLLKPGSIFLLLAAGNRGLQDFIREELPVNLTLITITDVEMLESPEEESLPGVFVVMRKGVPES